MWSFAASQDAAPILNYRFDIKLDKWVDKLKRKEGVFKLEILTFNGKLRT